MHLGDLFDPERVAVVGASATEGKLGHEAMANLAPFDGAVVPINPSGSGELLGEPFVESVADAGDVDLAILCVPAPVVPDVLAECGEAGVGAAVCYAGGFTEAGEEGQQRQERVRATVTEHDLALLGPNTSGFVTPRRELYASFAGGVDTVRPGGVTVVAQSGGIAHTLAFQAAREGRGVATMVGLGNRVNVGFVETIAYFDEDAHTEAIVLHVEGTDRGRELLAACRAAETPVVAYKVGQSDVDDLAESHTGALTGDHALYRAGFAQYRIPTVDSTEALMDVGTALANQPAPGGNRVGVVTAQAGPGIVVADRIQRGGGVLPDLSAETRDRIEGILPGITYDGNPVDTGRPMPEFGEVVTAVATDDNVDVVLVFELFEESLGLPVEALDGLAADVGKPILFATEGPVEATAEALAALRRAGVPTFPSPERAADAAATLARYGTLREEAAEGIADV